MSLKQRMGNAIWSSGVILILLAISRLEFNFLYSLVELGCGMIIWTGIVERVWGDG